MVGWEFAVSDSERNMRNDKGKISCFDIKVYICKCFDFFY